MLSEVLENFNGAIVRSTSVGMGVLSTVGRPDQVSCLAESGVLVLGIGVNDVVALALHTKVAACGSKLDVLAGHLRNAELLHILWLHQLTVLALFTGALE